MPISLRSQYDLEMLAVGAFSPLDRFMGADDYRSVLGEMRLRDGTLFPIPLALPVSPEAVRGAPREVALTDARGAVLAVLEVDDLYRYDRDNELRTVLGTTSADHPLVAESAGWPSRYLAGRPLVVDLPRHRLHGPLCGTPARTRARLAALGHVSGSSPFRPATPCTASTRSSPSAPLAPWAARCSCIRSSG